MRNDNCIKASGNALRAQYAHILGGHMSQTCDLSSREFWDTAWQEGVGAGLWHAVQASGVPLDAAVRKTCIEQPLRSQTAHTLMLRAAAAEVLSVFRAAGLDVVMLRGQSLAEMLYNPPTLRPQTDIDLLVAAGDEQRCAAVLHQCGFSSLPGHPLLFARGEVLLDVHYEPLGIERMASWALLTPLRAGDFFQHATSVDLPGGPALMPDASVLLPYLCFHAMKHSFERLIWLQDIALLAGRVDANAGWREVADGIARYRLERPCYYALSYAAQHLAAPVPGEVLDALQPVMDWRERSMFTRFMRHEPVPFLAERVFARMQPGFRHRLAFWRETIWPDARVRRQVDADPSAQGGFTGKRLRQIGRAAIMLIKEFRGLFRG